MFQITGPDRMGVCLPALDSAAAGSDQWDAKVVVPSDVL
jgi:hypothetical protein